MSDVAVGLAGVLVGACIPWLQALLGEWRLRKRDAQYLAIRIVCVLDKYVEDCAAVASDAGTEDRDGITRANAAQPGAPVFPEDINWKSIDHELMYELLSLPRDADAAERVIDGAMENAIGPDGSEFFAERTEQYGKLGLRAFNIAETLRQTYHIRAKNYAYWNPVDVIRKELTELEARQKLIAEHHKRMFESIGAPPVPPTERASP